jgi:hypothetical protein
LPDISYRMNRYNLQYLNDRIEKILDPTK